MKDFLALLVVIVAIQGPLVGQTSEKFLTDVPRAIAEMAMQETSLTVGKANWQSIRASHGKNAIDYVRVACASLDSLSDALFYSATGSLDSANMSTDWSKSDSFDSGQWPYDVIRNVIQSCRSKRLAPRDGQTKGEHTSTTVVPRIEAIVRRIAWCQQNHPSISSEIRSIVSGGGVDVRVRGVLERFVQFALTVAWCAESLSLVEHDIATAKDEDRLRNPETVGSFVRALELIESAQSDFLAIVVQIPRYDSNALNGRSTNAADLRVARVSRSIEPLMEAVRRPVRRLQVDPKLTPDFKLSESTLAQKQAELAAATSAHKEQLDAAHASLRLEQDRQKVLVAQFEASSRQREKELDIASKRHKQVVDAFEADSARYKADHDLATRRHKQVVDAFNDESARYKADNDKRLVREKAEYWDKWWTRAIAVIGALPGVVAMVLLIKDRKKHGRKGDADTRIAEAEAKLKEKQLDKDNAS